MSDDDRVGVSHVGGLDDEYQFECDRCGVQFVNRDTAEQCCNEDEGMWFLPAELKQIEYPMWVLWNTEIKRPLAPWHTQHLYPVEWGEDKHETVAERPEVRYSTAAQFALMNLPVLERNYGSTPVSDEKGQSPATTGMLPTIILPHQSLPSPSPPITFVDFDDIRDPETGEITDEVWDILENLRCYAEISTSGTGVHALVRGGLPEGYGQLIAPLEQRGHIEMYDHSRMVGLTGNHLAGTPMHTVPDASTLIEFYAGYYSEIQTQKEGTDTASTSVPESTQMSNESESTTRSQEDYVTPSVTNPYYEIDIRAVADTGRFRQHRRDAPGGEWQGPHPSHGAMSGPQWDGASDNFNLNPVENVWYCFAHSVGGGPLSLVAVIEGIVGCRDAGSIHDDEELLAAACIAERQKYAQELSEEPPPRHACVGVLRLEGHDIMHPNEMTPVTREHAENLIQSELSLDDLPV